MNYQINGNNRGQAAYSSTGVNGMTAGSTGMNNKGQSIFGNNQVGDLLACKLVKGGENPVLDLNGIQLQTKATEELTEILRRNHKIKEDAENDFTIRSQQEMMETMSSTMDTITVILVVAAAFSLLVAGIGIMNIMLVSVTERTKEIGLRMSVGARGIDIMSQFLIESILISLTGALLGIGLGYGGSWLARTVFMLPSDVPLWSVSVSFCVCAFIGIFFGYLPARKAARMDPIEALRYE